MDPTTRRICPIGARYMRNAHHHTDNTSSADLTASSSQRNRPRILGLSGKATCYRERFPWAIVPSPAFAPSRLRRASARLAALVPVLVLVLEAPAQVQVPAVSIGATSSVLPSISNRTICDNVFGYLSVDYGASVASLGDLDGDGTTEIVVGAPDKTQAVAVLHVKGHGRLDGWSAICKARSRSSYFGKAVANIGDVNGDGLPDLAIGAPPPTGFTWGPGHSLGAAVWVYFSPAEPLLGWPEASIRIGKGESNFGPTLSENGYFGSSIATLGEPDAQGTVVLAIGAPGHPNPDSIHQGEVYLARINDTGIVEMQEQGLVGSEDGLGFEVPDSARFGDALANAGDLNSDGWDDLAVGAPGWGHGGKVFILFMDGVGSVLDWTEIAESSSGFTGQLDTGDRFGAALASGTDVDRNGLTELLVGAPGDDDGGGDTGAVWRLFLDSNGHVEQAQKISNLADGVAGLLPGSAGFGSAVSVVGDVDEDGWQDIAVGALGDRAIWILHGLPAPMESASNLFLSPELPRSGQDIHMTAHWGTGVEKATIHFRESGTTTFLDSPVLSTEALSTYKGVIPSFAAGISGLEYFITLTNQDGLTARIPESGILSIPLEINEGLTVSLPAAASDEPVYHLLSIPLELRNPRARPILESALGPYSRKRWRFFGQAFDSGELVELDELDIRFESGRSYWLSAADEIVLSTGPGTTASTSTPYAIPLREGWNLVGNPYGYTVPRGSLSRASGIEPDVMSFRSGQGWRLADSLRAFGGYAVFNEVAGLDVTNGLVQTDTLWVNGLIDAEHAKHSGSATYDWSISVRLIQPPYSDGPDVAAVASLARDGLDSSDRPEPPLFGGSPAVFFDGLDWNGLSAGARIDARPAGHAVYVWPMEIRANEERPVVLSFENIASVPSQLAVHLRDDWSNNTWDLRVSPRVEFEMRDGADWRTFELVVGNAKSIAPSDPHSGNTDKTELRVYPNPFARFTAIRYELARPQHVELVIHDMLGRRVGTLDSGWRTAGTYTVVWDGRLATGQPASAGVYIASIVQGRGSTATTTLITRRPVD